MTAVLAQNSFGDTQSDGVAGPLGLFIVVVLVVATVLLIRNMNKRIKRLPDEFPPPQPTASVGSEVPSRGRDAESVPTALARPEVAPLGADAEAEPADTDQNH